MGLIGVWTGFLDDVDFVHNTSQDTEAMQASKGHLHHGEPRWRDKSGQGKSASQQRILTNLRVQTER